MFRSLAPLPAVARRWAIVVTCCGLASLSSRADEMVDLGKSDARVQGIMAPRGFKVQVVASDPGIAGPMAMAFDDSGDLYVAEWRAADRSFETRETLNHPDGTTDRIRRRKKSSTDAIKRLRDLDGDGTYESAEVVLEGVEMPSSILPIKNSLYLTCVGRLERWSDEDADGRFETRSILIDGFSGLGRSGLNGVTLGTDGWLYLTTGDGDDHPTGSDASRVDLARTGGVFRCRLDGSKLGLFARGFRNPSRGVAFNGSLEPFVIDDDPGDGSKFQGVRLIQPSEDADYGWRLRPGTTGSMADFDRAAADGDRPGKLAGVARLGRGAPSGLVVYQGASLPGPLRDVLLYPDTLRKSVRGLKVEPRSGTYALQGELAVMTSTSEAFQPIQVSVGADGAVYVLDRRGPPFDLDAPRSPSPGGRIYRITWDGDGSTPALAPKPNHWKRIFAATTEQLVFQFMGGADPLEADRAQRELVDRGQVAKSWCVGYAGNTGAPLHARLLGLQGARQFWGDDVETLMVSLLGDAQPEVRRLAGQALAWEPKSANFRLVAKLAEHLDDPDARVVREVALAIGRHAEPNPRKPAALILRWLYAHPEADRTVTDAMLRSLERMGDAGVEEVALAVQTRPGTERDRAVALFAQLRSAAAAEQLFSLVKIPDLARGDRLVLIRQFGDIPPEVPLATQGLADWVAKHPEFDPSVKIAALDACRLLGNPASSLILALLDDDDETVRLAATRLAAQSRPPGAMTRLAARLKNLDRSPEENRAIVRALGNAGSGAFPVLDAAYLAADDLTVRRATLRSMALADRIKAMPALESALTGRDPNIRRDAISILGDSPSSALWLGKAYQSRTLSRDDLPSVLTAIRKQDIPEVRKLLASLEDGAESISPTEVREKLAQGANPWNGLGIFFRESHARCASCHSVQGRGASTAPSLTIGAKAPSPDRVVEAILHHPRNKPVGEAARPRGERVSGLVELDDDVTRTGGTAESSLRPDRASIDLTAAEVADLAAFLLSKPTQDALRHGPQPVERVLAIGPFAMGLDSLRMPLGRVDVLKPLPGQDGIPARWISLESDVQGTMNLRGEFGSKTGRAYLAFVLNSPREQTAALRIQSEVPARVYLEGTKMLEVPGHDSFATSVLPDLALLPVKPGSNLVVIALDRDGAGDARIKLEIASPEPVELKTPRN